jgi:PUA domain protein
LKSNLISKSETAKIFEELNIQWKIDVPKQKNVRAHQIDEKGVIITGNGVTAVKIGEDILPFLGDVPILEKFPYVIVDMGAIKFVCKGANIMRPGITKSSDFEKGEIVCIIEESQHKFLAVGKAEMPSKQLDETKKGEVIKNMHYISDIFWESEKEIKY